MATKKRGRPAGEVQVGQGFDEMLKRLAEIYKQYSWQFKSEGAGMIDADALGKAATEQELDQAADQQAFNQYQLTHGPVMARQGARGAMFAQALQFARTAARGNNELRKVIDELKIREGGKAAAEPEPQAQAASR